MRSPRLLILAIAGIAAFAGPAAADETVGILHVEVSGVSETAAEMLESSLEDGLGNAGFKVAKRARMRELLEASGFPEGCRFGPCLQMVYEITGVKLVLVARITGVGRNFTYLVTLVDTRTGSYVSQATDTCAVCTVNEAVATASIAVIGLVTGAGDDTRTRVDDNVAAALDAASLRERQRAVDEVLARRKRSVTRGSVFLLGMAAVAGGVSATAFYKEDDQVGYAAAAAAGAFAISGTTLFVISRKF